MIWKDQRLTRLVYVSAASRRLGREELVKMGEEARRNNDRARVTGLLLYVDDEFFQVIEGPSDEVETLFDRIQRDARNRWVTPLLRERPFFRIFKHWSMGCFNLPFDDLPKDLFFRADWDQVRLRVNADRRQSFYRFLERFYEANVDLEAHEEERRAAAF